MIVYAVVDDALSPDFPLGDALEVFVRRDNLYRATGDIVLSQQLLRHQSVATTQDYLHPTRENLSEALASLHRERSS